MDISGRLALFGFIVLLFTIASVYYYNKQSGSSRKRCTERGADCGTKTSGYGACCGGLSCIDNKCTDSS